MNAEWVPFEGTSLLYPTLSSQVGTLLKVAHDDVMLFAWGGFYAANRLETVVTSHLQSLPIVTLTAAAIIPDIYAKMGDHSSFSVLSSLVSMIPFPADMHRATLHDRVVYLTSIAMLLDRYHDMRSVLAVCQNARCPEPRGA